MLTQLHIKNYAIIDSLDIQWPSDFIAITGETGAGNSIMIGALQFVLGARTDVKVLRNAEEKRVVEDRFDTPLSLQEKITDSIDIDDPKQIIIRREILPNGKSRTFINDTPALVTDINQIAPLLISIHQQFDHLDIIDPIFQLNSLDAFAELQTEVKKYQTQFKQYEQLKRNKKELQELHIKAQQEQDFLQFQWEELQQIDLKENEFGTLEEELKIASKSEEILNQTNHASTILNNEKGVIDSVQDILQLLRSVRINPIVNTLYDRLELIQTEIKDIALELESISEHIDTDPKKLLALQQRFDLIIRLMKKHRVQSDHELIQFKQEIESKLNSISHGEDQINQLDLEIKTLHQDLMSHALSISKTRKQKSLELVKRTSPLLRLLGMEFAQFDIKFEETAELNQLGIDTIEFQFTSNKGSSPKALKNQASGGEISRLNLVIKSLVAQKAELPTMIFDEIDTGVSGQVALQMGNILRDMSVHHQVITITHSPQVASRAKHHFFVYKDSTSKLTNTKLKKLEAEERYVEIAKMLSGDPPSSAALINAKELIQL
ncbi:MAG: DNA repair protein RecN [Saprospiraceae bacterium]|nr:DNA repair protein RecN [Candidatus Defluviibacterium haderslevense]